MDFFLVLLSGLMDRLRGSNWSNTKIEKFGSLLCKVLYSAVIAALIGHSFDCFSIAFIALYSIGMSFGWGTPLGSFIGETPMDQTKLEWWQFGVLKTDAGAALMFRGLLWAAPIAPLVMADENTWAAILAIMLAFPMSIYLSVIIFRNNVWAKNEIVRGLMNGAFVWMFMNAQYWAYA